MKGTTKKLFISCAALLTAVFTALGIKSAAPVAAQSAEPFSSLKMEIGASVRYSDEQENSNGLRFKLNMSKEEYETITAENSGYSNVLFGVLIAPKDGYELTMANVFGESAVYDWAEWDDVNGWVYNGANGANGAKRRIINISSQTLTANAKGDYYATGSIININSANLAKEFQGVGYVKYAMGGVTNYVFAEANDNVRSMTYVAQLAINAGDAHSDWLQTNYVDKVTTEASNYAVEYYLENSNGDFVKNDSYSEVKPATIDDEVTAEAKTIGGYAFDDSNVNNVLSGKVFANNKLVLKRYYKLSVTAVTDDVLNLADTNGTFDFANMLTANGKTDAANVIASTVSLGDLVLEVGGEVVTDVTTLEGVYAVTAKRAGITLYTGTADFYNSADGMVWVDNDNLSLDNVYNKIDGMTKSVKSEGLPAGASASQYYYLTDGDNGSTTGFVFSIGAIHSKAYYEMWKDKGISSLTFDIYSETLTNFYCSNMDHNPNMASDTLFWVNKEVWNTIELKMTSLLTNFDYMKSIEHGGSPNNMLQDRENSTIVKIYVGNFRAAISGAVTDTTVNLADTKGTFDFANMLTANGKTDAANVITSTASLGDLVLEVGGAVVTDVTKLEGVYSVTAKRAGIVIYTGTVDFYNSEDGMVWVDNDNLSLDNAHTKVAGMTKSVEAANLPEGASAREYYYITDGENGASAAFAFSIAAIHSKEYYEMWQSNGVSVLTFDVYFTSGKDINFNNMDHYPTGSGDDYKGNNFWISANAKWASVDITLEKLLANFDVMTNDSNSISTNNMLSKNYIESEHIQMYVGNFRAATSTVTE